MPFIVTCGLFICKENRKKLIVPRAGYANIHPEDTSRKAKIYPTAWWRNSYTRGEKND